MKFVSRAVLSQPHTINLFIKLENYTWKVSSEKFDSGSAFREVVRRGRRIKLCEILIAVIMKVCVVFKEFVSLKFSLLIFNYFQVLWSGMLWKMEHENYLDDVEIFWKVKHKRFFNFIEMSWKVEHISYSNGTKTISKVKLNHKCFWIKIYFI